MELPPPKYHVVDMGDDERDFAAEIAKEAVLSLYKNERRTFAEVAK